MASRRSNGTPGPVSVTETVSVSASRTTRSPTPPRSVNFTALPARLSRTWRSRAASPIASAGTSGATKTRDFQPFVVRARCEQLNDALHKRRNREALVQNIELARFDAGKIEQVLDQRTERLAGGADRLDIALLL